MAIINLINALNSKDFRDNVLRLSAIDNIKLETSIMNELAIELKSKGIGCTREHAFKIKGERAKNIDLRIDNKPHDVILEAKFHFEGDLLRIYDHLEKYPAEWFSKGKGLPVKDPKTEYMSELHKPYATHFLWIVSVRDGVSRSCKITGLENRYDSAMNSFYKRNNISRPNCKQAVISSKGIMDNIINKTEPFMKADELNNPFYVVYSSVLNDIKNSFIFYLIKKK